MRAALPLLSASFAAALITPSAAAQVATFAISREISVYAAPPDPPPFVLDAISREVSAYLQQPEPPLLAIDGISRECSVFRNPCPPDFNIDGGIDPDDLADFITCFFLDVQFPDICPAADFNGDGFRNPDDLADFITTFFLAVQFGGCY